MHLLANVIPIVFTFLIPRYSINVPMTGSTVLFLMIIICLPYASFNRLCISSNSGILKFRFSDLFCKICSVRTSKNDVQKKNKAKLYRDFFHKLVTFIPVYGYKFIPDYKRWNSDKNGRSLRLFIFQVRLKNFLCFC